MSRKILTNLALLSMGLFSYVLSAHELDLRKNKIYIGGHLAFTYELTQALVPQHKFSLNSDVSAGYFFFDRIAIGASLPIKLRLVPGDAIGPFGIGFFGTYFFKFNLNKLITPYAGLDITPAYSINEQAFKLAAGVHTGVLVSLHANLALDFGLTPKISFPLSRQQRWKLEIPVGFVGIRAFF
jgi:hypothetical protein